VSLRARDRRSRPLLAFCLQIARQQEHTPSMAKPYGLIIEMIYSSLANTLPIAQLEFARRVPPHPMDR
jgi:hypothetical protein